MAAAALVVAACAAPVATTAAVDLAPSAVLADAPSEVPDEHLVAGQVHGTVGSETGRVMRLLARHAATDDPAVAGVLSAATVIKVEVADHILGMAFPADPDGPLTTFVIDDRGRLPAYGTATFAPVEDPLLQWHVSGQSGHDTPSLVLVGGWAAPTVTTVAARQDGRWIVTRTTAVSGADARAWAVALRDLAWITAPLDEVAVYDDRGQLLAAAPATFDMLPRAAAELRGGGWRSADIGQRLTADADRAGLPYGPPQPVAEHTVMITNYGWAVQFARDQRRLHIGAGTRERAIAGDVAMDAAVTTDLDADAIVTGTVEAVDSRSIVAAGFADLHVTAVRIVFDDGAWLEVPTRHAADATPSMLSRVWAVHATREPSDTARAVAYYEALDQRGHIVGHVPANHAG